jgi:hypothetical protein
MRLGGVGFVLVVPGVAQGKPIHQFWIVAGFERVAQVRKVKTPSATVCLIRLPCLLFSCKALGERNSEKTHSARPLMMQEGE